MTPREIFYETIKPDGHPERLLDQFEAFELINTDPLNNMSRGNRTKGATTKDHWGVTWVWPEDQFAAMPHITPATQVCPDVTEWKKYVKAPDIEALCADGWEEVRRKSDIIHEKGEKLVMGFMGTGIFEQCHQLMGFEDTLANLLEEPEAMLELIEYIGEYRYQYAKLLIEKMHPDCILSHDDWGHKNALFMPPDLWRELFKPQYRRIYGLMKDSGVTVIHHGDCYQADIITDMAEIGVSVWQGCIPANDIVACQKKTQGVLTYMGGIDSAIDRSNATEDEIRAEVRRACSTYGPGGNYIPCMCYGGNYTVYPFVQPVISDEIGKYNRDTY